MEGIAHFIEKVSDEHGSHRNRISKVIQVKLARVLSDLMDACSDICGAMIGGADGYYFPSPKRLKQGSRKTSSNSKRVCQS